MARITDFEGGSPNSKRRASIPYSVRRRGSQPSVRLRAIASATPSACDEPIRGWMAGGSANPSQVDTVPERLPVTTASIQ